VLQKEGESAQTGMQRAQAGGGKRVLGKAMKGGGLLLKGKNPANVRACARPCPARADGRGARRSRGRRTTCARACPPRRTGTASS
jgi:hypothetical protein